MNNPVTASLISEWNEKYVETERCRVAARALSKCALADVMYRAEGGNIMRQKFSLELKTLPVTNQKHSGRCWLFAATNILRERIAARLNLANFELSQSWLAFWDKFERCNYFLENMIAMADKPADDRTVAFLLQTGVHDGGQWDMFANIVRKWGVVPKDVYDDTFQACNTKDVNFYMNRNLKLSAARLRRMVNNGASPEAVQAEKNEILGKLYAFLCSCYGVPPTSFDFEYVDKSGKYFCEAGMTPASFTEKYVGSYLDNVVSVINAPTADKPFHAAYTIRCLGNVAGMPGVRHINLPMDELKDAILRQMQAGKPVWFGSDVGKWGDRAAGIWDDGIFDAELVTGLDMAISKEDALDYGFSAMNHAMVLTGVTMKDGKPVRWKIENSWGDEKGNKGYYVCSDSWFDQYVYQAAIEKEYLPEADKYAAMEATELAPWDPMGTLAD